MTQVDMTRPPEQKPAQGTGPVARPKSYYQKFLPPCNSTCPAGNDIQGVLSFAQAGQFEKAWQTFMENNPLPATHGRICCHPCEDGCSRVQVDDGVSIHSIERFLGDMAIDKSWAMPEPAAATNKRILVIGASPSGLTAAYHLRSMGHHVEIRDAAPVAGGMLQFGILYYRLPRDILASEIQRLESMGITITLNHKVDDLQAEQEAGQFDAVFIAVGAHIGKQVSIPLALKIDPFFSAFGHMAKQFDDAGIDALVMFNRMLQPDFNLNTMMMEPSWPISKPGEIGLPLRWIGVLHGQIKASLAATSGAYDHKDIVKYLLAGADTVMLASVLIKNGADFVGTLRKGLELWMIQRGFNSLDELRGIMSQQSIANPDTFERANYLSIIGGPNDKLISELNI